MGNDLHLQVRVPFCNHRCSHCGTLICNYQSGLPSTYARALLDEIESASSAYPEYTVRSIAITGGSPACLGSRDVDALLLGLRKNFHLASDCSLAFKLTPGMISTALMDTLRSRSVARLDLSLQTTIVGEHNLLNRPYDYGAIQTVETMIETYHPQGLSIRLLVGIPGQTEVSLKWSLQSALNGNPAQIVVIPFQLIPGTVLYDQCMNGFVRKPIDEETASLYTFASNWLNEAGFIPYTISHFALPGREDPAIHQHLQGIEQLGLGLGAASRVDGIWYHNTTNLNAYLDHAGDPESVIKDMMRPSDRLLAARAIMSELATPEGTSSSNWDEFADWFNAISANGNLCTENGNHQLTPTGIVRQAAIFQNLLTFAAC